MDYVTARSVTLESLDERHPVAVFRRIFTRLTPDIIMPLDLLYAPDVVFEDPLHRLEGREQLQRYFARLNASLVESEFVMGEALVGAAAAMVPWTIRLTLRRLPRPVVVDGCSHLRYGALVTYQRDYFDVGALVYEHVPLLGAVVRGLKSRL